MKKIVKSLFVMLCVLAMPFALASCDIGEILDSLTGSTVKLEAGTYFVTTYEVNGEDYPPISNHDMVVTATTITFANGQMGNYELSGDVLTISNQQGTSLQGTLKYSNGTYTADLKSGETKVYIEFVKKEEVVLTAGTYFVTTYEVNGEDYPPISNHDMVVTATTITFANGQMGHYELKDNIFTLSGQNIELTGTIEYNNGTYVAELRTDGTRINFEFYKKA